MAVSHNGDVEVISTGSSVLTVSGGQVRVAATLSAAEAPTRAITVGSDGTIFVATPAGIVKIANGAAALLLDGPSAGLSSDLGALSLDGGGNLFIADNGSSRIIRLAPDGGLTLVAGTGTPAVAGSIPVNGQAAATSPIGHVTGLVVDRTGRLLIADSALHVVRAVAADGTISTVAGGGTQSVPDGEATQLPEGTRASNLSFSSIDAMVGDQQGRVYVADSASHAIVRFDTAGITSVVLRHDVVTALAIAPSGALVFSDGLVLWTVAGAAG